MSTLTYFAILALLIGFELGTLPYAPPFLRAASPVVVFLTLGAMQPGNRRIWMSALAAGLSFDWFSAFPFGTYTLAFIALAGFIIYVSQRVLTHRSFSARLLAVIMASLFLGIILALVRFISWHALHEVVYSITFAQALRYIALSSAGNMVLFLIGVIGFMVTKHIRTRHRWLSYIK